MRERIRSEDDSDMLSSPFAVTTVGTTVGDPWREGDGPFKVW